MAKSFTNNILQGYKTKAATAANTCQIC